MKLKPKLCFPDDRVVDRIAGQHVREAESARDRLLDSWHGQTREGKNHGFQRRGGAWGDAQGKYRIVKTKNFVAYYLDNSIPSTKKYLKGSYMNPENWFPRFPCVDEQVLGQMPALAESTPEEDSKADASNSASLYKVTSSALIYQNYQLHLFSIHFHLSEIGSGRKLSPATFSTSSWGILERSQGQMEFIGPPESSGSTPAGLLPVGHAQ